MFKSLPEGTGAIGIGILALLLGALQLARPYLHLSFELPIFAIVLLALGLIMLGSTLRESKNHE